MLVWGKVNVLTNRVAEVRFRFREVRFRFKKPEYNKICNYTKKNLKFRHWDKI